jgi:hypothetical protein
MLVKVSSSDASVFELATMVLAASSVDENPGWAAE